MLIILKAIPYKILATKVKHVLFYFGFVYVSYKHFFVLTEDNAILNVNFSNS